MSVVTPDHWHAIPTVRAFEAGKDVFVEKPLSYSVAEGRMMADASLKYKRVSQMGNHIHNDYPNYRRVVELVQSGELGRITRVHSWKTCRWSRHLHDQPAESARPLDYDFWLGPAPKHPYEPLRSHFTFRQFWDYSGGTFIDFWCHIVDVAVWAMDLKGPSSVDAARRAVFSSTTRPRRRTTLEAVLEYPDMLLTFSFRPTPLPGFEHMGHIGCLFEGTEASLVTNYKTHEVWVEGQEGGRFPDSRADDSRLAGHISRVPRRHQIPQPGDHLQRALRSSRDETGIAVEHRVSHQPADSLGRRAGADRRRRRSEQVICGASSGRTTSCRFQVRSVRL